MTFERAWGHRISVLVDGDAVPMIGADDLLANKRAAGRPKDLADVAAIENLARTGGGRRPRRRRG